jgi:hypothetical protein
MKTVVVLGMHRSATSLVAKALSTEISMGTTMLPTQPDNPNGFYENRYFVEMNDLLLLNAGGSWDYPPPREDIIEYNKHMEWAIKALIRREQCPPIWGWKDPRTVLTIDLYLPYLTNPHFVCVYRDPAEVAGSLARRGDMAYDMALGLCREYNSRLIDFMENRAFAGGIT